MHSAASFDPKSDRGVFPTFFMAGFECSTFIWKDRQRKDYVEITGHHRHLEADYDSLNGLGLGTARESVRWPKVDKGGRNYDWSTVDHVVESLQKHRITPIWDLCHYGWPDGCDPLDRSCLSRFKDYCRAVAERVKGHGEFGHFFTPVNEITFTSGAATDMEWFHPFAKGKYKEMKRALCQMTIEGAKAIREVLPDARMVHVDPMINTVPPKDRPDLADEAKKKSVEEACEAWDILAGRLQPELGGNPEILDVVGVNVYNFSQAQMNADGSREVLGPRDPRRKPLSEMLGNIWERYQRPIIIGETSGYQDHRAEWLRSTVEESLKAILDGVSLHGICLYPCVDIPDWQSGEWAKIGVYDIEDKETCERIPHQPYIEELRRWQRILDRPEAMEPDGNGYEYGPVQLSEVREYAKKHGAGFLH
jgi:beta-glucosidase/6-phospho-beta-glucosidase/beta-galactosidase